jgi:rhodanese-related sulfurtransferase
MFGKKSMDVSAVYGRLAEGAVLVDVRTKEEWREAHVPGAVRISLDSLHDRQDALKRRYADSELLVICRSGSRSAQAAHFFESLGINALNVRGGINSWIRKGLPITQGN